MPNIAERTASPRKDLHIFYILDTSGSMAGTKISQVNHAVDECQEALIKEAKHNGDANLKIAILEFNSNCNWATEYGPVDVEDFIFNYLETGGLTDVGLALEELNSKLSRNAYLKSMTGALMPVFIFMTDGWSTSDYSEALGKLRKNKWFARGIKIGFAIGDEADRKMISEIVGNSEAVIQTSDMELFVRLLKWVSITASMLASESRTSTNPVTGASIVQQLDDEFDEDVFIDLDETQYDKEPEYEDGDDDWFEDDWD